MSSAPPSPSQHLTQILEPLRATIAAHASKHWAVIPVLMLLHSYLGRLARRFAALATRLAKDRPAAPRAPRPDRPAPGPGKPRLPQTFAWLSTLAPETNVFGYQLKHLLGRPEMQELLEASPQVAKILRPLCGMLGISRDGDLPPALLATPKPRPQPRPPGWISPTEPSAAIAPAPPPPPGLRFETA